MVSLNVKRQRAISVGKAWMLAENEGKIAGEGWQSNSGKVRELIKDARTYFAKRFGVNSKYRHGACAREARRSSGSGCQKKGLGAR